MKKSVANGWYHRYTPWVFLFPTVIGLAVFRLIPIGASFFLGFTDWNLLGKPIFVGLDNYRELFSTPEFWGIIGNTVEFSLLYVLGSMLFGLLLALLIDVRMKGIGFFRACVYLPVVTSAVAVGIVWDWLLGPGVGLVNVLLERIGVNPPYWLSDARYALKTVTFVQVWKMSGYYMILFLAGLQTLPKETLEAAKVDGASVLQTFFHVKLPLFSPTMFFVLTVTIIDSFKNCELIYAMTKGGPQNATNTLVYDVYLNAFAYYRVGFASAISLVLFLFVGVMTLFNFYVKKYWAKPWE